MFGGIFFRASGTGKINGAQENLNDKKSLKASENRHDDYLQGGSFEVPYSKQQVKGKPVGAKPGYYIDKKFSECTDEDHYYVSYKYFKMTPQGQQR